MWKAVPVNGPRVCRCRRRPTTRACARGRGQCHTAAMSTAMKPTAPPVGRIYEDGLSTEELRALLEVEGGDVVAGTLDAVHGRIHRLIDKIEPPEQPG